MLRRDGLRAPEAEEWPALRAAVNRVFRPNGGDLFAESPLLFDAGNRTNLRVLVRGGEIVSHAGLFLCEARTGGPPLRVACLGAVLTVPEHRGSGLAAAVVAERVDFARHNADLLVVSGEGGLYRRFGLTPVPAMRRYAIAPPERGAAGRADLRLRPYRASDLQGVISVHAAEPIRFERTAAEWQRLLAARHLMGAPAEVVVVLRDDSVVAYAAIQIRSQAPRQARDAATAEPVASAAPRTGALAGDTRRVLELAGDRDALLACLAQAADELLVPAYDIRTATSAERLGWIGVDHQLPISAAFSASGREGPPVAGGRIVPWYGLNYA